MKNQPTKKVMSTVAEILISTYTDPNDNERTIVFRNRGVMFGRKRQDRATIEKAKDVARRAYNDTKYVGARIVWWDGDTGNKHVVAEKDRDA